MPRSHRLISQPRAILMASVPLAVAPLAAPAAQDTIRVQGEPVCRSCTLTLARQVTVGDTSGPGMVAPQAHVRSDSRGRYYVSSHFAPGTIQVFDQSGGFQTTIGRFGHGPGEFADRPQTDVTAGDTLLAADPAARRLTVFGPDHGLVRTLILPAMALQTLAFPDGRLLISGPSGAREVLGQPLHLITATGELIRSFGKDDAPSSPRDRYGAMRIVAPAASGKIWAGRMNSYVLERWDTSGIKELTIIRSVAWFRPWTRVTGRLGTARQPPHLTAIRVSGDTLWVYIRVDDANWRPRPPVPFKGMPGATWIPDSDKELLFDTRIEAIHVRTGELLISAEIGQNAIAVLGSGEVVSYEEDAAGNPRYVVWRVTPTR